MNDFKYKVGDTVGYTALLSMYRTRVNAVITAIGKTACLVEIDNGEYFASFSDISNPISDDEMSVFNDILKLSKTLNVDFDKAARFYKLGIRMEPLK